MKKKINIIKDAANTCFPCPSTCANCSLDSKGGV